MNVGLGEMAAMATAFSWGVSTQIQGAVGRMVGSTGVTLLRMPYQIFFVTLLCLVMRADNLRHYGGFCRHGHHLPDVKIPGGIM